jgi:DNA polymerase III delta prime subunit
MQIDGQPYVSEFLSRAVSSGSLSHAYLFAGGTQEVRLQTAHALADELLGPGPQPDLHILEPAGKRGYKIEQARELIHDSELAPVAGEHKIYVLDEVQLMNDSTANALLKTLEEPTPSVLFLLLAKNRESVLPTIASRTITVPFAPVQAVAADLTPEVKAAVAKVLNHISELSELALLDHAKEWAAAKQAEVYLTAMEAWLEQYLRRTADGRSLVVGEAIAKARRQIGYNVGVELTFDALLLTIQQAFN